MLGADWNEADDKLTCGTVANVKPITPKPGSGRGESERRSDLLADRLTDVEDPSIADGPDDAATMEALDEEGQGKTTPGTDAVTSSLPEKNSNATACESSDHAGEDEHASKSFRGWIYSMQDAITDDENRAGKRKGVKSGEKEGSPEEPSKKARRLVYQ